MVILRILCRQSTRINSMIHILRKKNKVNLLKYIMSDYHANYEKPAYYTDTNKCMLYSGYIIPIFKYFSALYKNILFMW